MSDRNYEFDAIVVGTGMSGGMAMKELCERGLKTLALDRGNALVHREGYVTEHKPAWEMPHRGRIPEAVLERDFPVQRRTHSLTEYTQHLFASDRDYPIVEEEPYSWIQTNTVGGRSQLWGRQSYRLSPMDFTANLEDGHGVDWPIRYEDIAPWYDYVERFIGVSGSAEGLAHLPDGEFLKPMDLNVVERHVGKQIEAAYPGRRMIIGRTATLTEPLNGRAACHYCGPCERGCSTTSFYSTVGVALPAARKTGRLTLKPNALVETVLYDDRINRATGVRVIDTQTKEVTEYRARIVFLCGSAPGTARILLHSKSDAFPTGLANSSDQVGRNLMDHHARVGAGGSVEGFLDRWYQGNRPNGFYIPRFQNLDAASRAPDFVRGYGFQGGAGRGSWKRGQDRAGMGPEFKALLRQAGWWGIGMQAFGETLPHPDNRCVLDDEVTDAFGIPALRVRQVRLDNELAMRRHMAETAAEMLENAGVRNVSAYNNAEDPPGSQNHEMGTARMGRDPGSSVLNQWNQCHDVPNLFVTDGSCMTSSACQNPSLTYLALTARASAKAVDLMKEGVL